MATISIKDLANSVDLDREAMTAITGGARTRGSLGFPLPATPRIDRIVDYPPGVATARPTSTHKKPR